MSETELSVAKTRQGKKIDLAIMFALCGTLFSLLIFIFMLKQEREASVQQFNIEMAQRTADFQQKLTGQFYGLERLQTRLELVEGDLAQGAEESIAAFVASNPTIHSAFISQSGTVQASGTTLPELLELPVIKQYIQQLDSQSGLAHSGFRHADTAYLIASQPLVQGGHVSSIIMLDELFNSVYAADAMQGVTGSLLAAGSPVVISGDPNVQSEVQFSHVLYLPNNSDWKLQFTASDSRLEQGMSWSPALFLLTGLLLSFLVASYLKRMNRQLQQLSDQQETMSGQLFDNAWHDPLTGLINRTHFDETLDVECRRSVREFSPMTLMLLRIDHFEQYVNHYGEHAADLLLQQISTLLRKAVSRPGDMIARLDGCLFGLILPSTNEQVVQLAQRCNDIIREQRIPHEDAENHEFVTLSIGVATLQPSNMLTPDTLLDQADRQLNNAVEAGGDQYQAYAESTLEPSATFSL